MKNKRKWSLHFTCEHAGYRIPPGFPDLNIPSSILKSHRGWDPGALDMARYLSRQLNASLHQNSFSRLAIDCNRSAGNPQIFSPWSRSLPLESRLQLLKSPFSSYKWSVEESLRRDLKKEPVAVFSIHSFSPVHHGHRRTTDLGLLFRPQVALEKELCKQLKAHLQLLTDFRLHFNLPYRGHTDCFVNELSKTFLPSGHFVGIMLELNFALMRKRDQWEHLKYSLASSISSVLD